MQKSCVLDRIFSESSVLNCYASIFSCSVTHVTQVNQRNALTLLSREGSQHGHVIGIDGLYNLFEVKKNG